MLQPEEDSGTIELVGDEQRPLLVLLLCTVRERRYTHDKIVDNIGEQLLSSGTLRSLLC